MKSGKKELFWVMLFCTHLLFAQKVELVMPLGHQREVNKAIFTPDGKQVYTASADHTVSVWDAITGHEIRKFRGHSDGINDLAISSNGRYLVTVSNDGKAMLWSTSSGKMLKMMPHHGMLVNLVCISPITNFLVTASYSEFYHKSVLTYWGLPNGNNAKTIEFPNEKILCLTISLEKKGVLLATDKGKTYEIGGDDFEQKITEYPVTPEFACFDDATSIVLFATKEKVNVFNLNDAKPKYEVKASEKSVISAIQLSNANSPLRIGYQNGILTAIDLLTGEVKQRMTGHHACINAIVISNAQALLVTASNDKTACIYNTKTVKIMAKLEGKTIPVNDFSLLLSDHNMLTLFGDSTLKKWKIADRISLEKYFSLDEDQTSLSNDNEINTIATSGKNSGNIINGLDKKIIKKLLPSEKVKQIVVAPDGSRIVCLTSQGKMKIGKAPNFDFTDFQADLKLCRFSDFTINGNNELIVSEITKLQVYDMETGKLKKSFKTGVDTIMAFAVNDKQQLYALATSDHKIKVFGLAADTAIFSVEAYFNHYQSDFKMSFAPNGKYLAYTTNDLLINLLDIEKHKITHNYFGHTDEITNLQFTSDSKFLMSSAQDNTIRMWQVNFVAAEAKVISKVTSEDYSYSNIVMSKYDPNAYLMNTDPTQLEVASFIALRNDDWIITTPDRYYFCNKGAAKELGYNKNGKYYSFEQFDLKFNRPDIVLKRIGIEDVQLIEAYKKAYEKRLRKMGFTEEQLNDDLNLPELKIKNFEFIPTETDSQEINFNIEMKDEKYALNRLYCWINGVALYGKNGLHLDNQNNGSIQKMIPIALTPGMNNIRFSVLNSKGVESYKSFVVVEYHPKTKPVSNLLVIAISVSEYKDATMNLRYAAKDGRDIVNTFLTNKSYQKITVDTFFNRKVNKSIIAKLKSQLGQTNINDEVVVFISGHGMLNSNLDFYFATYDMDFNIPDKNGISFEALEDLLDSIPARKKLMLMDACHSGEMDKEEAATVKTKSSTSAAGNVSAYEARSSQLIETDSKVGLENSFEMMQELFAGINKGSGAVIISAAAGKGYAFESPKWNNGVFSYCFMNGIMSHEADKNKDNKITATEMLDYVSGSVELLTNGAQKPTSRKENLEYDWVLWEY